MIAHYMQEFQKLLEAIHPAWLLASMVLLPLVGVPITPIWIATGMRLGPLWGSVTGILALALNDALAYELAARWLRRPIRAWLERHGRKIPVLDPSDEAKLIVAFRLTPGFPLPIQNYLLGCAHVHFWRYLLLSLPIQAGWAVAFVICGNALTQSSLVPLILAASLLVVVGIVISILRKRFARKPEDLQK